MQFIEADRMSIRSATWVLRSPGSRVCFRLFPMVHFGTRQFYDEVTVRIGRCDLIVAEGDGAPPSRFAPLRLKAYTLFNRVRRSELVYQHIDYRATGRPVVYPDRTHPAEVLTGPPARRSRDILLLAGFLLVALPIKAIATLARGSRRFAARASVLGIEDSTVLDGDRRLAAMLLSDRDKVLNAVLTRLREEHDGEFIDIAVVYGAAHMPAVVRFLNSRYGYRPYDGEWLTVHILR